MFVFGKNKNPKRPSNDTNNFDIAYEKVMGIEGGYSNDPDDMGGETYMGIARNYHPDWIGWNTIDLLDDKSKLHKNEALQRHVKNFYKENYYYPRWDMEMSPQLATEMFDCAVILGLSVSVKFLQVALNCLNRNGEIYNDLIVDGIYGNKTHKALTIIQLQKEEDLIYKIMNIQQGQHFITSMKKHPTNEKYARGWFKRIDIRK